MAKTIRDGYYCASSPADGIHTHAGILRGFLISCTSSSTTAVITFYDNTTATGTVLMAIDIHPTDTPYYLMFPRDFCPRFATGLSATFTNSRLHVWSADFG